MQQKNAETVRIVGPNKDIIRMTETILKQNDLIIKMNMELLRVFANPSVVLNSKRSG